MDFHAFPHITLPAAMAAGVGPRLPPFLPGKAELLSAINAQFHVAIEDAEVVKHVLDSPLTHSWYRDWLAERSAVEALPDCWGELGIPPAELPRLQARRAARQRILAEAMQEIAHLAQAYQDDLRARVLALHNRLASMTTPLVKVMEAGYPQLPAHRKLVVERSADRKAAKAAELAAARREWLAAVRAGDDPLPGWVGCSERKLCWPGS